MAARTTSSPPKPSPGEYDTSAHHVSSWTLVRWRVAACASSMGWTRPGESWRANEDLMNAMVIVALRSQYCACGESERRCKHVCRASAGRCGSSRHITASGFALGMPVRGDSLLDISTVLDSSVRSGRSGETHRAPCCGTRGI